MAASTIGRFCGTGAGLLKSTKGTALQQVIKRIPMLIVSSVQLHFTAKMSECHSENS
jgi:hypothetical protein